MATLHIEADADDLVVSLAKWVSAQAEQAILERGRFSWALSGGSTPKQLFATMAEASQQSSFPWDKTDLFWGDERDVLPTHPDSNFGVADAILLRQLSVPPRGVYRWQTEYRPPAVLADYRAKLEFLAEGSVPEMDLVLLGLGPEGHTASLFPHSPVLASQDWVAHVYVPEHATWRYTLTLSVINRARTIAFLVTGEAKAKIVQTIQTTPPDPLWPATMVADDGRLHWFLDRRAASQISH
ncbi:MAG: 6-phosphogluconolactonase [Firmicutes bacterium]|jgi:6-phosphogluconolactonase|nr:6-phosphogluconolactonase [Bacillota bacterium]